MSTLRGVTVRYLIITGSVIFLCTILLPLRAHAQLGLLGIERALSISLSPLHPSPGETVELAVKSSVLDLGTSTILWRANGKTIAQGVGVDSAQVTAGALGVETDIEVGVIAPDWVSASGRAIIIPTELDLLIDSDSYIPPFYRGRALVSAGTTLELSVIPRFKRPSGPLIAASDLIYTWRRNGEVLGSISGRGKSSVHIPFLHLYGADNFSVEVRTQDGVLSGEARVAAQSVEPMLALYEDHPLYGILYHRSLGASTFIPESEMTFAAVPYFSQARSVNDPTLMYGWRVNGALVPRSASAPSEITINATNSNGIALIELELTHTSNFYTDVKRVWNIMLSSSEPLQDQFRNTTQ
ncbi:MAG: hypothetical protein Q7S50_02900 [bacterium]|nr:hypothetical protein [bacterium]